MQLEEYRNQARAEAINDRGKEKERGKIDRSNFSRNDQV